METRTSHNGLTLMGKGQGGTSWVLLGLLQLHEHMKQECMKVLLPHLRSCTNHAEWWAMTTFPCRRGRKGSGDSV